MVFAQAVAEYGAIASIVAGVQQALNNAQTWVTTRGPTTWVIVGALVILWLFFSRSRGSRL